MVLIAIDTPYTDTSSEHHEAAALINITRLCMAFGAYANGAAAEARCSFQKPPRFRFSIILF